MATGAGRAALRGGAAIAAEVRSPLRVAFTVVTLARAATLAAAEVTVPVGLPIAEGGGATLGGGRYTLALAEPQHG